MADLMASVPPGAIPIGFAWIVWLAWGSVQLGWYRRARLIVPVGQLAPRAQPPRRPSPRPTATPPAEPAPAPPPRAATSEAGSAPSSRRARRRQARHEHMVPDRAHVSREAAPEEPNDGGHRPSSYSEH